MDVIDSWFYN